MTSTNTNAFGPLGGPGPETTYPMPSVGHSICFLKNVITNPNIEVGDYTYYHDYDGAEHFEKRNVIYHEPVLGDKLIIGKFCQIALETRFIMNASTHQMTGFSAYPFAVFSPEWAGRYEVDFPINGDTVVGNDVWFGYRAIVMPGVTIGDGAIIATGALVNKDVPPYTIVGGSPAKPIRQRFDDATIEALLEIKWWDWPLEVVMANLDAITGADMEKLKAVAEATA